jgi:hypothetical protein
LKFDILIEVDFDVNVPREERVNFVQSRGLARNRRWGSVDEIFFPTSRRSSRGVYPQNRLLPAQTPSKQPSRTSPCDELSKTNDEG